MRAGWAEEFYDELNCHCGAPSYSKPCLFFSNDLLRLRLQSVQYDLQHDFVWVADKTVRSVGLTLLQVFCRWKCDEQELGPQGWPFSACGFDLLSIIFSMTLAAAAVQKTTSSVNHGTGCVEAIALM